MVVDNDDRSIFTSWISPRIITELVVKHRRSMGNRNVGCLIQHLLPTLGCVLPEKYLKATFFAAAYKTGEGITRSSVLSFLYNGKGFAWQFGRRYIWGHCDVPR